MRARLAVPVFIALSLGAGAVGSLFTAPAIPEWYASLAKPPFNPPAWVFAPAWTILYVMMGTAAGLVWNRRPGSRAADRGLLLFGIQLVLNAMWSVVFFGLRTPPAAMMELIVLAVAAAGTTAFFHRVSRPAAYLMLPYLAWLGFAALLNASIVVLNPIP